MKFKYKTNIACLLLIKAKKMSPNSDFESQFFNPFSVNEELKPDVNYYLR